MGAIAAAAADKNNFWADEIDMENAANDNAGFHAEHPSPRETARTRWVKKSAPYQEFGCRINGCDEYRSGTRNRAYVGELIKQARLDTVIDPRIFHHDASGGNLQTFPLIRWAGGWGRILIRAVGEEAIEIVSRDIHKILHLVQADVELPISYLREAVVMGRVSIREIDEPRFYVARDLIFARRKAQLAQFNSLSALEQRDFLAKRIVADIRKQADCLGLDMGFQPDIEVTKIHRVVPVSVSGMKPETKSREDGYINDWVYGASVEFRLFAKLEGNWAAGGLVSRGYGHITHRIPVAAARHE